MRIISQRYIGDGQFMLQLGGLSSETKPTDAFVATGSQFFEDDTDSVFTFSGLTWNLEKNGQMKDLPVVTATDNGKVLKVANGVWSVGEGGGGGGADLPDGTNDGDLLVWDATDEEWRADSNPNAPLIVTLTEDQEEPGTWVSQTTTDDVFDAYCAGKTVVCKLGNTVALSICGAKHDTTKGEYDFDLTNEDYSANGDENESFGMLYKG